MIWVSCRTILCLLNSFCRNFEGKVYIILLHKAINSSFQRDAQILDIMFGFITLVFCEHGDILVYIEIMNVFICAKVKIFWWGLAWKIPSFTECKRFYCYTYINIHCFFWNKKINRCYPTFIELTIKLYSAL